MNQQDIKKMLDEIGIQYAYHHFEEESSIAPPFLVYIIPKSDNFAADGKTYFKVNKLNIELYTDIKSEQLEKQIEDVLDTHGIFYEKDETFIDSEQMYEVLYEMEV